MMKAHLTLLLVTFILASGAAICETPGELVEQVRSAENGFAKTMADRDIEAFATFLADEAVFFGEGQVLRGKEAIIAGWSAYYQGEAAPFSWKSEVVEVLDSGTLAHSSGPVMTPGGKQVGTFNSIWRREADGSWKVVFDKGCPLCD